MQPIRIDPPAASASPPESRGLALRDVVALFAAPAAILALTGWYHGSDGFPHKPPFEGFFPLLSGLAVLTGVGSIALAVEALRLRSVVARTQQRRGTMAQAASIEGVDEAAADASSTAAVEQIQRLQREVDTLCAIRNLTIIANDDVDLRRVLQATLDVVAQVLEASSVQIYLLREGGAGKQLSAPTAERRGSRTHFSEAVLAAPGVAGEGASPKPEAGTADKVTTLSRLAVRALLEQRSVSRVDRSSLAAAAVLMADGETLGVLVVRSARREDPTAVVGVLEALAKPIALAIRKPALYERAVFDGLTGLYTKRHFSEQLARYFSQSCRLGTPLALLMCDIDHFKRINDTHGHLCGDAVLSEVARVIRDAVREYDSAYRYGGEEMTVISPNSEPRAAEALAERLRGAVEALEVVVDGGVTVRVTVSVGVATFHPDLQKPDDLIALADRALYAAKRGGRNRVVSEARSEEAIPAKARTASKVARSRAQVRRPG